MRIMTKVRTLLLVSPLILALALGGCGSFTRVSGGVAPAQAVTPTASAEGTSSSGTEAGGTPVSAHGTLKGTVTAGPTCPVETNPPSPQCAPRPVANRQVNILTTAGAQVVAVTTDANGVFSTRLAPGTYQVKVAIVSGQVGMRQMQPVTATVVAGQTMSVEIELDTGIR